MTKEKDREEGKTDKILNRTSVIITLVVILITGIGSYFAGQQATKIELAIHSEQIESLQSECKEIKKQQADNYRALEKKVDKIYDYLIGKKQNENTH